jgi:putative PIN family toxin of toxin-antitoxin system
VRAVLDPNVIISALLSPTGAPATVLRAWFEGAFEAVISPGLLSELERALTYPKLRERISRAEAEAVIVLLREATEMHEDPTTPPPVHSSDPGDDYLIALAAITNAVIVTGDHHLLDLNDVPVDSPATFLQRLGL